jgi:acyl transferase domain-containing protein
LKRFEDAHRDGDRILAIIKGSAVNNDGAGTSFGTPNEVAQEKVYRAALDRANVKASDVSFVETHGTGTAVGN